MGVADSRNEDRASRAPYGNGLDSFFRAIAHLTTPTTLVAAFGLGCLYAVSQGMRITTLTGVYPANNTLVLRYAAATMLLLAFAIAASLNHVPYFLEKAKACIVVGVALSFALLAQYSSLLFGVHYPNLIIGGKLAEEALCWLMMLFWARIVLDQGFVRASIIVAYAFVAQAIIQLFLFGSQRIPCAILLCLLPSISSALYCYYVKGNRAPKDKVFERSSVADLLKPPPFSPGLAAGIVFLLSFVLGNVILRSLEFQSSMADSPFFQLCVAGGNMVAALIILFSAPSMRSYSYCIILLLSCFACCAISLYLTTFLANTAAGSYLIASSLGLQGAQLFVWYAALLLPGTLSKSFRNYVLLCVSFCFAKVLASFSMTLTAGTFDSLQNSIVSLGVILLFFCSIVITARALNDAQSSKSQASPESTRDLFDSNSSTNQYRGFFREAVASLAREHGLTRQETRVLFLLAKGLNADLISKELVVSINTAKSHRQNVYAKLNVHSQQELIALVDERKILIRAQLDERAAPNA